MKEVSTYPEKSAYLIPSYCCLIWSCLRVALCIDKAIVLFFSSPLLTDWAAKKPGRGWRRLSLYRTDQDMIQKFVNATLLGLPSRFATLGARR